MVLATLMALLGKEHTIVLPGLLLLLGAFRRMERRPGPAHDDFGA